MYYPQTEQNILICPQSVTFVHIFFTALSSMSSESGRSVTSGRSNVSQKSGVSNSSSWFSIGSLSNFQASRIIDAKTINRPPRVSKYIYNAAVCLYSEKSLVRPMIYYYAMHT